MIDDAVIRSQLRNVIWRSELSVAAGERYEGKVRDSYTKGDKRILVATDRLSCFDVVVTAVPFKGQVLTQLAAWWFEKTKDILPNHVISLPDPNVMVVKQCEVLPIEVVVRAYLAGSAWRDYEGGRTISGVRLPPGLRRHAKLPEVILTPSTKAKKGSHDQPISEAEILSSRIVPESIWKQVKESALALFKRGSDEATKRGLILVDTKYEFGLLNGRVVLVDEIHTLDSSRFWVAESYPGRLSRDEPPEMLDKEPVRQWLLAQGYMGEGEIPAFTEEKIIELARHYTSSFERLVGEAFVPRVGSVDWQQLERELIRSI